MAETLRTPHARTVPGDPDRCTCCDFGCGSTETYRNLLNITAFFISTGNHVFEDLIAYQPSEREKVVQCCQQAVWAGTKNRPLEQILLLKTDFLRYYGNAHGILIDLADSDMTDVTNNIGLRFYVEISGYGYARRTSAVASRSGA